MPENRYKNGIAAQRLTAEGYRDNFSDIHPPLGAHEAVVAADRCYFCYDAPCVRACPTEIDIPLFIRQIATGDPLGSAKTIFDQNILGGMCARVCPTETLCEQACVRMTAEEKPVDIGLLQRYATDAAMHDGRQFYRREENSGRGVAVVGAGPAGLACAHRLAMHGHQVTVFEARQKSGGLNEYGIAAYKTPDDFAQKEIDYILAIGNIRIEHGQRLGGELTLAALSETYDATFLAVGLSGVNALKLNDETADGMRDAVDYIGDIRQAADLSALPVGRRVVVIGGGMTAIDVAVQSKLLGAEEVTICYRREQSAMRASEFEQHLAVQKGVVIRCGLRPRQLVVRDGAVCAVELEYSDNPQETLTLPADQVFKAIGQNLQSTDGTDLKIENGKLAVDAEGRTSVAGIWAGGDCAVGGDDLTVSAVAMGRDAAESIHRALKGAS